MVDGFIVDEDSPKPNCVACTEAKQHIELFPKLSIRNTEPGELMHIDLWGKYMIRSINGNQYYLLFVYDAKRFATVECIKKKSDTGQLVINYLAHLKTHGRILKGIQIDNGKEFVNEGESVWDMPPMGVTGLDDITLTLEPGSKKHKRNLLEGDIDINTPWKTCGIHIDYKILENPYPEEENEDNFLTMDKVYAIIAGDELMNLKDTKKSPDWPEWQIAIQAKLDLLKEKWTWELVEKPPDAIPIANKWVFIKKHDKQGKVIRYRARLMAK